jgi:hypothetical protein
MVRDDYGLQNYTIKFKGAPKLFLKNGANIKLNCNRLISFGLNREERIENKNKNNNSNTNLFQIK